MSQLIPNHPLEFIQQAVREHKIFWTYHINLRLRKRSISREAILTSIDDYELIESYPHDKYSTELFDLY